MSHEESYLEMLRRLIVEQYQNVILGSGGAAAEFGTILCHELHYGGDDHGLHFTALAAKWGINVTTLGELIYDHCRRLEPLPVVSRQTPPPVVPPEPTDEYRETLREINDMLSIPAAEYVPAIGDVFLLIDRKLQERGLEPLVRAAPSATHDDMSETIQTLVGRIHSSHQHRYPPWCPECKAQLWEDGAIEMEFTADGVSVQRAATRLDRTGYLQDVNNVIAAGLHSGTRCAACEAALDDYEGME